MLKGKRFYQKGIRFECQGEGGCCETRGQYGHVYLSYNDRRRLAARHKMSTREFTSTFTDKEDGLYKLRYSGRDCPFLLSNRCRVYEARPSQCRTWPFWPENMNSEVWEKEVASWRPGAGKGRLYTAKEIEDILLGEKDVLLLQRNLMGIS